MTSTSLIKLASNMASRFGIESENGELLQTLKQTAFKGNVSDAQMTALILVAQQYGLNPFTREIYAFPDQQNGIIPVVGVDGWTRIINEHPQFDGLDFVQNDEQCTCIIYRKDRNHPIKITEYHAECYRDIKSDKSPWKTHPKRMLRHKALIQCARIAFGFVGIYDTDEAERIKEAKEIVVNQVMTKPVEKVIESTGEIIIEGEVVNEPTLTISDRIDNATTEEELQALWKTLDKIQRSAHREHFTARKSQVTFTSQVAAA